MRTWMKHTAAVLAILGFATAEVTAILAAGFSGDSGLFIQEYWEGGVPKYAIYNAGTDTLDAIVRSLAVGKRHFIPEGDEIVVTPPGVVEGGTLAVWQLAPEAVTLLPAVGVPDTLLRKGQLFGVYGTSDRLYGVWSDAGMRWPVPESGIATYAYLNVPGSRPREAWVVQDRLWYESGQGFQLDVVLGSGSGVLEITRGEAWASLPPVGILGAECRTLDVSDSGRVIAIDALTGAGGDSLHHVLVSCVAPEVEQPTMACLKARLKVDPGWIEQGFYRGILVRPREANAAPPAN
jgi:hypothetical protein